MTMSERMNAILLTMRATQGTPYFDRAIAAMSELVERARSGEK